MEQNRTPAILPDHPEQARPAPNQPQIIIDLISATSTATGLTVRAELDTGTYPIGIKYTNKQIDTLPITRHDFHGEWNYTLCAPPADTPTPT